MIGSLSLFSPGSLQSYGASPSPAATPQGLAGDTAQPLRTGFGSTTGGGTAGSSITSGATLLTAQEAGQGSSGKAAGADDLSEEEQAQVAKLKQIDAKVRAHERAHASVGGAHAGAPSYTYTRGPDGQMYATGGEVAIDIGAESDPEATLQKATQVAAAALAPADPSGQDRAVAAAAAQLRLEALAQIREQKRAEQEQQQAEAADAKAERAERQEQPGAPTGQTGAAVGGGSAGTQSRTAAAYQQIGRLVGLVA